MRPNLDLSETTLIQKQSIDLPRKDLDWIIQEYTNSITNGYGPKSARPDHRLFVDKFPYQGHLIVSRTSPVLNANEVNVVWVAFAEGDETKWERKLPLKYVQGCIVRRNSELTKVIQKAKPKDENEHVPNDVVPIFRPLHHR